MNRLLAVFLFSSLLFGQQPKRPKILGVAHISLFAHDLEKSKAFYTEFLGFSIPFALRNSNGSVSLDFVKINDRQYIELVPEKQPGSDRLNHIALQTDDAEAMRLYLASRGIKVPDRTPKGRIGNLNFMIKDPEGHDVEIVQYAPNGWTAENYGKQMTDACISNRMMHVGIIVIKLDAEDHFYKDILGFSETWRGSSDSKVLSWTNLKVPDGQDYVELMLYAQPPPAEKRGTAHHLALEVTDAAASVNKLKHNEYFKNYDRAIEVRIGKNRKRQVNLFDPDGTRTELMEGHTIDGKPARSSDAPPPRPTN